VQVALRRLIADHHISITGNVAGGAPRMTPTYVVHPRIPLTGGTESPVAQRHPPRWHNATPPVAQRHPPGGTAPPPRWHSDTQTLIEPSLNPQLTLS
jgi:hypothetical protein